MFTDVNNHIVRALSIAGSDSGGGAGIQADLKTMHQFGVYGSSVITALTAQNTIGVQGIVEVSPDFVKAQLDSVLTDIGADAVKTGMLANQEIIHVVSNALKHQSIQRIVVDPVMAAKGGESLLASPAVSALREFMLPLADVVTPNIPEASILCGFEIETWRDYHKAAQEIASMGAKTVVIKGGHMAPESSPTEDWCNRISGPAVIDIVYSRGEYTYFITPRVASHKTHGTGCTFSAAITSMLARGTNILNAIASAKLYIFQAIQGAKDWDVGNGYGPTDHSVIPTECQGIKSNRVYVLEGLTWTQVI